MKQHIDILGILYLVLGVFGMCAAVLTFLLLGGAAGIVALSGAEDADIAIPILGGVGGVLFGLLSALSIPSMVVGWGLMKRRRWARVGGLILSALHIPNMPVGTILGGYGLWILSSSESEPEFARESSISASPSPVSTPHVG